MILVPAQGKSTAEAAADKKDEEPAEGLDVYLALINGVVGRNKALKYDNGALQVRLEDGCWFSVLSEQVCCQFGK